MPGQSPSSTLNNGNASTPDPPVSSSASSSDADRLRASMEAWKRTAAIASERYSEARQRQIAAEREDRHELRKRWLEEEAKKRAESVGKQKDAMSGGNVSSNMPPPLYQSTPINNRDRKRHLDNNDYGHEEWRQGFRMMEGGGGSGTYEGSAFPIWLHTAHAKDLGCNAVNEDNMTKMLTSIRTDSLGMLGADAVDSLFDSDVGDNDGAAGQVPTPPALANSGSVPLGNSCASSAMIEQSLRSPAEDLGCNAVNEDNMTKMLTSIRTDSLGMLGADAVDSLFDSDVGDNDGAAGQVPLVTSTDSTSSPTGFSHGGPRSAHSVHSAPQSNSNCNPPSTPTPSAPLSTPFPPQVPTSQPSSFPQSSPQSSTFRPPSSPQSARYPSTTPNRSSSFPQNSQSQAPFFQQPPSSQSENFPPSSMASSTNFPMASSSQSVGFPPSTPQPSNYPQQNAMQQSAYAQQMPSGVGYPTSCPQPSTSNPYACGPSGGMMSNAADPAFMGQQGMVNPGYPGYDMPSSAHMSQQQQMAMQAHHQQQMMMGVAGAGGTMSAQQYHMVMMQKHQQHMKAVMQQRGSPFISSDAFKEMG
ncbi:MamL-1 domain protein [Teladorsagia circumcincta]|uniref:MamL-1 domain protein n=1 Tax=Teladorsagia circumcincta TaxID=45464 RepID=A0A2G9TW70_TELCI|nr:MamL-1 domain protein [Teladorsagia circumcincta]